jgi:phospholipase C
MTQAVHGGLVDKFPQFTSGGGLGCAPDCATVMGYYDGNTVTAPGNYAQHFAMRDFLTGTSSRPQAGTAKL